MTADINVDRRLVMVRITTLLALGPWALEACTVIGIGREASADGSVMVAHTDDSGGMGDPRLVHVPARDWPAGAMRPVYLSIADYPRLIAPDRAPDYSPASPAHANLPWATPLGAIPQVHCTTALRTAPRWAADWSRVWERLRGTSSQSTEKSR